MLEGFVRFTIGPFLIAGGLLTAVMFIGAVAPKTAATRSLKLPWDENYSAVVRHWGFIVGTVGVMLLWAFFDQTVLFPAMLFSAVEKAFLVCLVLSGLKKPWARGFVPAAVIDGIMVLYALLYFAVLAGNRTTSCDPPARTGLKHLGHPSARPAMHLSVTIGVRLPDIVFKYWSVSQLNTKVAALLTQLPVRLRRQPSCACSGRAPLSIPYP